MNSALLETRRGAPTTDVTSELLGDTVNGQPPTLPTDPSRPASRSRWPNSQEVY